MLGAKGSKTCGVTANWYEVSFWADKNVLELHSGNGCTTLNIQNKKNTDLDNLKIWTLWYVDYISKVSLNNNSKFGHIVPLKIVKLIFFT